MDRVVGLFGCARTCFFVGSDFGEKYYESRSCVLMT